jgi:Proliferating cell nuclear antigen, C-terminal domain
VFVPSTIVFVVAFDITDLFIFMLFTPCIFIYLFGHSFLWYTWLYPSVEFKLMDIDSESLNIPEMSYVSVVSLPSEEFQRIVRDLQCLGDVCTITAKGDSIKFLAAGDLGSGSILLRMMSGEGNCIGPVMVSIWVAAAYFSG